MRRPALLAALLCAALLGGCSLGPSDEERAYTTAFEEAWRGLPERYRITDEPSADATPAQLAARVGRIQRLLRDWAANLERVRPPAEAREPHRRYVAGLRGFADDLDAARRKLAAGGTTGQLSLSPATRDHFAQAQEGFEDLQYDLHDLDMVPELDT